MRLGPLRVAAHVLGDGTTGHTYPIMAIVAAPYMRRGSRVQWELCVYREALRVTRIGT